MLADFTLTVLYTQVVVHVAGLDRPGLLWTDDHVAQGFAWAEGIASFGVPDHDGECELQVETAEAVSVDPQALWALRVPFRVPSTTPLQIGTITDMRPVTVPPHEYSLVFQAFAGRTEAIAYILRMSFAKDAHPDFEILKKGDGLTTDKVLRRDAEHG